MEKDKKIFRTKTQNLQEQEKLIRRVARKCQTCGKDLTCEVYTITMKNGEEFCDITCLSKW